MSSDLRVNVYPNLSIEKRNIGGRRLVIDFTNPRAASVMEITMLAA